MKPAPLSVRCAIYTRKSSEEGLDQSFNSLHAQREACEAYVKSQISEGWKALPATYDDGGFSGGSMQRPALGRLLADIEAGRVDVVVVYKVDRLTRSIMDFGKIVEAFDRCGVSFVSITQSFNTTTSMGRLTLNMLLSFAQYEREVTGERIRDKIAASKKKGMWMGGPLPLGYDAPTDLTTRALTVNPTEAETVRLIFRRYLELGSVHELQRWLDGEGIRSKAWTSSGGRRIGGCRFARGALFHLLKNRTYIGEIPHRSESYPGAHSAIVDRELFDEVQVLLETHTRWTTEPGRVAAAPLKGLIFDADGEPMSPVHTHGKAGRVHRYYVSSSLLRGGRRDPDDAAARRVPGPALERLVQETLARLTQNPAVDPTGALARLEIKARRLEMVVRRAALFRRLDDPDREFEQLKDRLEADEDIVRDSDDEAIVRVSMPCRFKRAGGAVRITDASGRRSMRASDPDETLIASLKAAHALLAEHSDGPIGLPEAVSIKVAPSNPYKRCLIRLAFLAPDIQSAILEGRQPAGLNRQRLVLGDIPCGWDDQRRAFGFT